MEKLICSALALVAGLVVFTPTPASALEYGKPAPNNAESSAVASLRMGKIGQFGDCTGTLVADQWVLTARHCLESVRNEGTQARFGKDQIYDVDAWAMSPTADAGLLHLTKKAEGITPAAIADTVPQVGKHGTFYGWSSSSTMARKKQLPMTNMKVLEQLGVPGGGPGAQPPAAPSGEVPSGGGMAVPAPGGHASEDGGGMAVPAPGGETVPGEVAPAPQMSSPILHARSTDGAGIQGGDSGGSFFVDGKLAGLGTAGTAEGDADLPSPTVAITSLAGLKDWVDGVTSGRDKQAVLTSANTPDPAPVLQTSADHIGTYLAVSSIGLVGVAAASRLRRRKA
ncbi:MAG: trypsin-like serine protease [Propionibacteriaceae bacterium]|nr:trypsin-like serine protease [Propionibacteriaceae bacterium]